jgi:ferredoxin-type protein NapF
MQRRELFNIFSKPKETEEKKSVIRPPYFQDIKDFAKSCVTCQEKSCITVCQEKIIVLLEDDTVGLDFSKNGCTYCDECANACQYDVLSVEYKTTINQTFSIELLKCISWNETMCFSCKDRCLDNAIKYIGLFRPEIDNALCTNCGFCVGVCPTDAIKIGNI